jgi:hypothetical protein
VEVPPVTVINPTAGPSTAPYGLRSRKGKAPDVEPSLDELGGSSDEDTPMKVTEMPPGIIVPRVQIEAASPPKITLPVATGNVGVHDKAYCLSELTLAHP